MDCKDGPPTLVLAHRGSTEGGPGGEASRENTVAAFRAARRLGADGIELDVRLGADGTLVVHHDAEIPRRGRVANLSAHELPSWVPSLDEALAAAGGMVVDVEVKHDPVADPGRRLADRVGALLAGRTAVGADGDGPVLVSSFDPESLDVVGQRAPGVPRGLLVPVASDPRAALGEAVRRRCAAVHPFVARVDRAYVAEAHRQGLAVVVWTVDADADLDAMVAAGVDALITDRVAAALRAVRAHPSDGGSPRPGMAGPGPRRQ